MIRLAVWLGINRESYDCAKCPDTNCDREGRWPGSTGPAPYPKWSGLPREILEGLGEPEGLRVCPLSYLPDWWPAVARKKAGTPL